MYAGNERPTEQIRCRSEREPVMVADGVHIMLAVALVVLVVRTDRAEPYLVAIVTAGVPDLDWFLFTYFAETGYLTGQLWTHRGITHSLFALLLCVGVGYRFGFWRPAALGYGSHLVADFLTGEIQLLAPFSTELYGMYYDWVLGSLLAGAFALLVIVLGLGVMVNRDRLDARGGPWAGVADWFG